MKKENVLVVRRKDITKYVSDNDIKVSLCNKEFFNTIQNEGFFLLRSQAENEPEFKQVIPYIFIIHNDFIYVTNRKTTQTESRLHNKYSIGIGGHINEFDIKAIDDIVQNGMIRELNEEVIIDADDILQILPKALISDDTNDVGKVHIGIVYQILLKSDKCTIRETEKMEGRWVHVSDIDKYYDKMETWSQITFSHVIQGDL